MVNVQKLVSTRVECSEVLAENCTSFSETLSRKRYDLVQTRALDRLCLLIESLVMDVP